MKYTINRNKWVCGLKDSTASERLIAMGGPALLNRAGRMCCLGQCSEQNGVKPHEIRSMAFPHEAVNMQISAAEKAELAERMGWMVAPISQGAANRTGKTGWRTARVIAEVNDSEQFTASEREAHLVRLFENAGHSVEFVGTLIDEETPESDCCGAELPCLDTMICPECKEHCIGLVKLTTK